MISRMARGSGATGSLRGRKSLKAKKELPPVDPSTLTPEALAQRERYRQEEEERRARAAARQAEAAERAARDAASGKRVVRADLAVKRRSWGES